MCSRSPGAPCRSARLHAAEDGRAGEDPAAQWTPLAPHLAVLLRPLRFDDVGEHESGRHEFPDTVADRTVMLDVRRRARPVVLDVRPSVEVRVDSDEAALTR